MRDDGTRAQGAARGRPGRDGSDDIFAPMLNRLRQIAPAAAFLVCLSLLAMWMTGAHAHRHVGRSSHSHALPLVNEAPSAHDHAHAASASASHAEPGPLAAHPPSQIHDDGHENVELQGLRPPPSPAWIDLPLVLMSLCAFLASAASRPLLIPRIADPPLIDRIRWSWRPPLRGPPSFSAA